MPTNATAGPIMSNHRKALIANGLLVLTAALTALLDASDISAAWGCWITYGMGASLIYSGATDFCGFAVIFEHLQRLTAGQSDRP